jgi:hypothetical protein
VVGVDHDVEGRRAKHVGDHEVRRTGVEEREGVLLLALGGELGGIELGQLDSLRPDGPQRRVDLGGRGRPVVLR